ncbi:MAG: nucleotide exchange factor GrpE [Candidatus Hodarchaeales archaeon]|jgi:molecular chaperone GrpE
MSQKKAKSNEKSETEIVDIDYQINEAQNKDSETSGKGKSDISVSSETDAHKELLGELQQLYKQLEEKDELYDKIHKRYLSALADYENLEKRTKADRTNILKQANQRLLLKLIDIADSFDKAERSMSSGESVTLDSVVEGIKAVRKQFDTILRNEGVEKIEAIGEKFDPNFHEVVFVKSDSDSEEDTILEEVQVGYFLNSKVIRPTKVVVVKKITKGEK